MELTDSTSWLIAGAVLIALEILVLPGIGALFAGLGALTVGVALIFGWIESLTAQFSLGFLATGIWALVLWKPLKKILGGKGKGFGDMVGSTAVVFGEPLEKGRPGQVRWSGTVMKCQLEDGASKTIAPGQEVTISRVSRGILIVQESKGKKLDSI